MTPKHNVIEKAVFCAVWYIVSEVVEQRAGSIILSYHENGHAENSSS
jgi:hypothetical protein